MNEIEALIRLRIGLIEAITDVFGNDFAEILLAFARLAGRYAAGESLDLAEIAALGTSAELFDVMIAAGLGEALTEVQRRFATVLVEVERTLAASGIVTQLDRVALSALTESTLLANVELIASPAIQATKTAWIRSRFLGSSVTDAIENAVAQIASASEGVARTQIGTALSQMDQAAALQGAANSRAEIVYIYIGPLDGRTRRTCEIARDRYWTLDQIARLDNGQIPNVLISRGGWNCRHTWSPIPLALAIDQGIPAADDSDVDAYNSAGVRR